MKNKIILGIILIAMIFCLCGCSSEKNYYNITEDRTDNCNDRFITIREWTDTQYYNYFIRYDKETTVEYLFVYYDFRSLGITPLLNADGTPLLYGGE